VLVLTLDTTRADHIGSYGYTLARTPNIDRLASEGVRCTDAIASAPITAVSHSTIFTGLQPPTHGVRDNGSYTLSPAAITLAERLRGKGYATHAIVSALVLNRRYGLDQGFDQYDDDLWSEDEPKLFMIRDRPARKTADRALDWLASWRRGENRKPFFMWVH
jgi:arylsulfatase A-like enzyme